MAGAFETGAFDLIASTSGRDSRTGIQFETVSS